MSSKKYNYLIILSLLIITIPVYFIIEPLDGDLTRIGWFSENSFGWNGTQEYFLKPLAYKGSITSNYDVIILGDSFSDFEEEKWHKWPHYLAYKTGLDIGVFHRKKFTLHDLEDYLKINNNKPVVIIYEIVERALFYEHSKNTECPGPYKFVGDILFSQAVSAEMTIAGRDKVKTISHIGYVTKFILKNCMKLLNLTSTNAQTLPLVKNNIFSSNKKNEILVFKDDLDKRNWTDNDWTKIRCNLLSWQEKFEKDYGVHFITMVAPDKTTIYSQYIDDIEMSLWSKIDILDAGELHLVRFDKNMKDKINNGLIDLYLPNNTHWSSNGHDIAANITIDILKDHGILVEKVE